MQNPVVLTTPHPVTITHQEVSPVIIQQQNIQTANTNNKIWSPSIGKAVLSLGIIHIVMGFVCITCGIREYTASVISTMPGIWIGISYLIIGIIGVAAGVKKNSSLAATLMILCIIDTIATFIAAILAGVAIPFVSLTSSASKEPGVIIACQTVVIICCVIEFCLAIATSILACKGVCGCCREHRQMTAVTIQYVQAPAVPVHFIQQSGQGTQQQVIFAGTQQPFIGDHPPPYTPAPQTPTSPTYSSPYNDNGYLSMRSNVQAPLPTSSNGLHSREHSYEKINNVPDNDSRYVNASNTEGENQYASLHNDSQGDNYYLAPQSVTDSYITPQTNAQVDADDDYEVPT